MQRTIIPEKKILFEPWVIFNISSQLNGMICMITKITGNGNTVNRHPTNRNFFVAGVLQFNAFPERMETRCSKLKWFQEHSCDLFSNIFWLIIPNHHQSCVQLLPNLLYRVYWLRWSRWRIRSLLWRNSTTRSNDGEPSTKNIWKNQSGTMSGINRHLECAFVQGNCDWYVLIYPAFQSKIFEDIGPLAHSALLEIIRNISN